MSVTVRLGEVVGLGSKMQNASITLTSGETRFAFRAAATVGGGSAGVDLVYDPTGRIGQATLTATATRVPLGDSHRLTRLDLGLRDAVADIDLRLRGGGRTTRDALNSASGSIDVTVAKGLWPRDRLASWPAETQRLLSGNESGVPFKLHRRALRRERRRGLPATAGHRHATHDHGGWRLPPSAAPRDGNSSSRPKRATTRTQHFASPLRLKGGSGRRPPACWSPTWPG